MVYRELAPPPALRPYVDRFWLRVPGDEAGAGDATAPARILPDGCIDVLVDADTGAARVVGTMTRAVVHAGTASRLAAVRFRPGGAHPFLRVGSAELTDRVVDVASLGARWLELGAGDPSRLVVALERALLRRDVPAIDRRVREASRRLLAPSPPSIADLSDALDTTRQQLARAFRQHVGISPKELARVVRLQRALYSLQREPSLSLAAAALASGYYDQAHMSLEFRDLAGITPLCARRAPGSISPIPSLWQDAG
jgi:AraC-like DNA-binding protein